MVSLIQSEIHATYQQEEEKKKITFLPEQNVFYISGQF